VARKIKRSRAELVTEFLSAMQLHFHGDLRCPGKHRVKALRRLLTIMKLVLISPGEPNAREQLAKLMIEAVDRNDWKFFDDFAKARKEKGMKNVLKDYAFMMSEQRTKQKA
jgi:hypothetical protein